MSALWGWFGFLTGLRFLSDHFMKLRMDGYFLKECQKASVLYDMMQKDEKTVVAAQPVNPEKWHAQRSSAQCSRLI